jgi:hypothetical protein
MSLDNCVCYFFFRYGTPTLDSVVAAYRAILAQILQYHRQDQDLLDRFAFAMSEVSGGQLVASRNELLELLQICTQSIENCFIILDGVDECDDSTTLVKELLNLTSNFGAKLLIFSRPNVLSLSRAIPESQHLVIGRSNCEDICLFLSQKLDMLYEDRLLPPSEDKSELLSHLVTGADGMFQWAWLMINYLKSLALTPTRRVRTIMEVSFPEGLEAMYGRIMDLICQGSEPEVRLAQWAITFLAYSKRPLTVCELQESIRVMHIETQVCEENLPDFELTLVITCAGLIEQANIYDSRYKSRVPYFRFIHLSAREYSTSSALSRRRENKGSGSRVNPLLITKIGAHLDIARGCLQYLTYCVPAQPLGGKLGQNAAFLELDQALPLCNYAVLHWVDHLKEIISECPAVTSSGLDPSPCQSYRALFTVLAQFLSQKFVLMAWIEANYVFNNVPSLEQLEDLSGWIVRAKQLLLDIDPEMQDIQKDLPELRQYLKQLHSYWGSKLMKSPAIMWEEVTAFTPNRLLPITSAIHVSTAFIDNPTGDEVSSQYLCKVSEVSSDGSLMAILSIWPSRYFPGFSCKEF